VVHSNLEDAPAAEITPAVEPEQETQAQPGPVAEEPVLKTVQKKTRRRLPTTPEREVAEKPIRRSKRITDEKPAETAAQLSPIKSAHAQSHENGDRSPSPQRGRPVTVTKKRTQGDEGRRETQVMQIALPFADTPIQRRNKEMRKTSAEGHRRSSTGMRGRRASSVIDEGRGHGKSSPFSSLAFEFLHLMPLCAEVSVSTTEQSDFAKNSSAGSAGSPDRSSAADTVFIAAAHDTAQEALANKESATTALPHAEVPATEFYKHISADITEPRRMRSLLGWCGTRLLPAKPHPPNQSSPAAMLEFQAQQAGMFTCRSIRMPY
jgi:kinetochore protein Mis13/DSN1